MVLCDCQLLSIISILVYDCQFWSMIWSMIVNTGLFLSILVYGISFLSKDVYDCYLLSMVVKTGGGRFSSMIMNARAEEENKRECMRPTYQKSTMVCFCLSYLSLSRIFSLHTLKGTKINYT